MPMYEYRCADCQHLNTVLVYSWSSDTSPTCKRCSSDKLTKLISRFTAKRSWGESLNWVPSGETLTDINEDDPNSVDQFMGRLEHEMGGQTTQDFKEMRRELFTGPKSFDSPAGDSPAHGHDN